MTKLLPVIVILVLAIGGGYYFYSQQGKTPSTDIKTQAAKQVNKSPKIGIVSQKSSAGYEAVVNGMKKELEKRGYTPTYLQDDIVNNNFAEIADKYADQKVDVIVANSTNASLAAKKATTTIPVVFGSVGDPVLNGIVTSLESSGTNVTGVSSLLVDLTPQRVDLLKQLKPGLKKFIWVTNSNDASGDNSTTKAKKQAEMTGLTVTQKTVATADEAKDVLSKLTVADGEALLVATTSVMQGQATNVIAAQNKLKIPVVGFDNSWAERGTVASLGPDYSISGKQVGEIIDQILNGKAPKDIPVQRPEKIDLIINKKAAAGIGLVLSEATLKKADRIIE